MEVFTALVRVASPGATGLSENDIKFVRNLFEVYLVEQTSEEVRRKILPSSNIAVVLKMDHPLTMKGIHPALVAHFHKFLDVEMEKIKANHD